MTRGFSISLLLFATVTCFTAPVLQAALRIDATSIAGPLLAAHNRQRAEFGSPMMTWDPVLAAAAATHAVELARLGRLQHAPKSQRPGQGENLWIGPRGNHSLESMVSLWTLEKRYFQPGLFPANSSTGNWADVGHYTQMVWPTTSRLGCAVASSGRWEVLVCRYSPPGNRDGVMLGRR